jgi:heme a synthase
MQLRYARWTANVAVILALVVVMLGAYTRLTDAGLGCPDWPGCYGRMLLPHATDVARPDAQALYPDIPIESGKAWTEMVHRYAAGTLGFLVLVLAGIAGFGPKNARVTPVLPMLMVGLLIFQAALGMWTVTLQLLPVVVMGHLLGGMTLTALIVWLRWRWYVCAFSVVPNLRLWVGIGLCIVATQIALGGWVSSNYAGLACLGFPQCNQHWLPMFDWSRAFDIFSPIGANYQGGTLDLTARVTIQWTHRAGAVVTALYILGLTMYIQRYAQSLPVRYASLFALSLVLLQFVLGVMNVVYMLPLSVAVLHNGVALLLLLSMVSLYYLAAGRRT